LKKPNWRINNEIRANTLRVINAEGEFIGVMSREDALAEARKAGVDLVEIAPAAEPPVAKVIEFGKFKYIQEKKERAQKKKAKPADLKEVRLSPFIAEGDYKTRTRRIDAFLKNGHKVRVVVVFKGRHLGNRDRGYELMREILDSLISEVSIDMEPKFLGRHLAMVISPLKSKKVDTRNAVEKPEVS
jgi:translation initiation factor IF-3